MLDYAVKLTKQPEQVTARDLGQLREAGFSDRDVLDICEVTAYYAYANRVANGLGVQLEKWFDHDD